MKLSFHGGVGTTTGSCHLLETLSAKILVDCGFFQTSRECDPGNFDAFKFLPSEIDALFVTHAHLDHIGRIPRLVAGGFKGKIYSTAPCRDLSRVILEDALHLGNKEKCPAYSAEDIEKTFTFWEALPYREKITVGDVKIVLRQAGHILGSALIEIYGQNKHILFTGDLGNVPSILLPPPDRFNDLEYLIIESTYGARTHEPAEERQLKLERAVEDATRAGGTLMIPAFATERTQEILFLLNKMLNEKRIPEIPVFVDAPLAIKITHIFEQYAEFYLDEIKKLYLSHPHLFQFKKLRFTESVEESKSINQVAGPKVVIAGSGMMTGGRILHHARRYLPDPKSMLLITGFQTAGSLGRRIIEGEKNVKIYGEEILIEAEIRKINGFSAHADNPQLFAFVEENRDTLKKVWVVQGEDAQAKFFSQEIKDRLGIRAETPKMHEEFEI